MSAAIRSFDWSRTPLGPIDTWPQSLRTAVSICLGSRFPMMLWWGPELINIHNDAFIPVLGGWHPTALGRSGRDIWIDTWPVIGSQVDKVMKEGGSTLNERVRLVYTRHGYPEETWFTWSFGPIRDESGRVAGLFNTCLEDTAAVRAESVMRGSEQRFRALATASAAVLYQLSADWSELQPLDGKGLVPSNEAPIRDWLERNVPEPEHAAIRSRIAQCVANKTPFEMEHRVHRPDGSIGWTRSRAVPLLDGAGEVIEWVGTAEDITERRRADEALKQSEERFRLMADAVPQIIWITDADGRTLFFNQQWFRYTGAEDVPTTAGDVSANFIHPDDQHATMAAFDEARRTGGTFAVEHRIRSASGEFRWFLVRGEPHCDEQTKQITRWFGASVDIHDSKSRQSRDRFLIDLDDAVRPLTDAATITATYARLLGEHLGADRCAYADVEADQDTFNLTGDYNAEGIPSIVGRYTFTAFGREVLRLMRADQPYVVEDVDRHDPPPEDTAAYRATMIQAVICVPLHKDGRFVAAMAVHQRVPRRWKPEEVRLVQHVAGRCWESIERARVERTLRQSEERLTFSIAAGELGTFYCPMPLGRIEWNAKCKEHFWLPPDAEVDFDRFYALLHPDDRDRTRQAVEHAVFERRGYDIEYRTVSPDGRIRWVRAKGRAYYDARGEPTRFDGVTLDITAQKEAEANRLASERRFREMADTAPAILWITEADGNCSFLSRGWYELTGQTEAEAIGVGWVSAVHPDDRAASRETFVNANRQQQPFAFDYRLRHADGAYRWAIDTGRPRYGPSGEFLGFVGSVIDIHDRKVAEEQRRALLNSEQAALAEAERASRMKDEFLATLSHELRTPLNAILGWSQILAKSEGVSRDVEDGLRVIERNARAQTQIIEDLLDMSRIISGKARLDVQPVDLASVVGAAVDTVRPTADAKGVRLQVVLDPLADAVSGDPNRLQQIFWNLLTNAVKFTPRGGRVQVVLERVNSHLEVAVADTGSGISPEFLPHVFDRFRQADASTTRRHGGLGLGLAIAKQLVEMHGGSVRVKSAGEGTGSTFTVALPLAPLRVDPELNRPEPRHPGARSSDSGKSGDPCVEIEGLRVLVVDDEPDARALVKRLLEDCGAQVRTAASASEALQLLADELPDVLLSDIGMPNEDGYSLIRRLRTLSASKGGQLPAAALTAYARSEDRVRAMRAGFQSHIVKPVEPLELVTVVATLAGRFNS